MLLRHWCPVAYISFLGQAGKYSQTPFYIILDWGTERNTAGSGEYKTVSKGYLFLHALERANERPRLRILVGRRALDRVLPQLPLIVHFLVLLQDGGPKVLRQGGALVSKPG